MEDSPALYPKEDLDPEVEETLQNLREELATAFDEDFDTILETLTQLCTENINLPTKIYHAMRISFISGGLWTIGELIEAKEEDDNGN